MPLSRPLVGHVFEGFSVLNMKPSNLFKLQVSAAAMLLDLCCTGLLRPSGFHSGLFQFCQGSDGAGYARKPQVKTAHVIVGSGPKKQRSLLQQIAHIVLECLLSSNHLVRGTKVL